MKRKHALVTGGTSGIVAGIVRGLALRGADVTFLGRDLNRGRSLEGKLHRRFPDQRFQFLQVELASSETEMVCIGLIYNGSGLPDVLLNNAGGQSDSHHDSFHRIELISAVNHLSHL